MLTRLSLGGLPKNSNKREALRRTPSGDQPSPPIAVRASTINVAARRTLSRVGSPSSAMSSTGTVSFR
jgi:hypothetical protein